MGGNPVNRPNLFCASGRRIGEGIGRGKACGGSRWARPNNFDFMIGSVRVHARARPFRSMVVRPPGGEPGTSESQSFPAPPPGAGDRDGGDAVTAPKSVEKGHYSIPEAAGGKRSRTVVWAPSVPMPQSFFFWEEVTE